MSANATFLLPEKLTRPQNRSVLRIRLVLWDLADDILAEIRMVKPLQPRERSFSSLI